MMKKYMSYLLPVIIVCAVFVSGYIKKSSMQLCNHTYALCTSAKCIPQPNDPTKAICFCDVEEGKSMGTVPCKKLQPSTDINGIQTVFSTFSLKQLKEGKKQMKCPAGTPWTWCLNQRCTVDPTNPKKAICTCDVMRKEEWVTFGGNCNTSTCEAGYWSGAAFADAQEANAFMMKAQELDASAIKWCKAASN